MADVRHQNEPPAHRSQPIAPKTLGLPTGLIADVAEVGEAIEHLHRLGVNVLAPVTRIQYLPPGFRLAFRAVLFPFDGEWSTVGGVKTNGTWYSTDGGFALLKASLRQLAAAAGLSWDTVDTSRDRNRWTIKATGRIRTMDGAWRELSATKDWDLRDDGPIVPTWAAEAGRKGGDAEKRVLKAREHGGRMAESKAVNAMIRDALGLRSSYSADLARRPFVFPLLVYVPETAEARQLQAAVELGVVGQLYGPGAVRAPVATETMIDVEPELRALPEPAVADDRRADAKVGERQKTAREAGDGRASDADLRAYCASRGWSLPDTRERWGDLRRYVENNGAADFANFRRENRDPELPEWAQ
jgi:hypothetical protein